MEILQDFLLSSGSNSRVRVGEKHEMRAAIFFMTYFLGGKGAWPLAPSPGSATTLTVTDPRDDPRDDPRPPAVLGKKIGQIIGWSCWRAPPGKSCTCHLFNLRDLYINF